jgi:hypothetical protein
LDSSIEQDSAGAREVSRAVFSGQFSVVSEDKEEVGCGEMEFFI